MMLRSHVIQIRFALTSSKFNSHAKRLTSKRKFEFELHERQIS